MKERIEDFKRRDDALASSVRSQEHEGIFQFQSECTLRVTIANHDTQVLCVWVGDVLQDSAFQEGQWTPPPPPASHSVVPGQAVQVSCRIPVMPFEQLHLAGSLEDKATNWIHSSLCGYWQSVAHQPTFTQDDASPSHDPVFGLNPSYGSQGTVPIRKEHVAKLLNTAHLSTIVHAYITLSVCLSEPYTKGFIDLREHLTMDTDLASLMETRLIEDPDSEWNLQGTEYEAGTPPGQSLMHSTSVRSDIPSAPKGPNGEVWGIQTEVGEFLNCEAIVANNTGCNLEDASISICSERVDESGESADILFRRESGLNDAGILLIGRISDIPVTSNANTTFTHKYRPLCVVCLS